MGFESGGVGIAELPGREAVVCKDQEQGVSWEHSPHEELGG